MFDVLASLAGWIYGKLVAQFVAQPAQTIGCCAHFRLSAAAGLSWESASAQLALLSREALGIEPLNRYHFVEVILGRGCTWTYLSPLKEIGSKRN